MALISSTTLYQREILADGTVQVCLSKNVLNGDACISAEAHRFGLAPGSDLDLACSQVNTHLAEMGFPPMLDEDWTKICQTAAAEWTPDVVAAYRRK